MRILLVEDDDNEAFLVEESLRDVHGSQTAHLRRTRTLEEGVVALREDAPDVVLLDLSLPDSFGLAGLDRLRREQPGVPVVVRTGNNDDATALEAVRRGAQDYLIKGDHGPSLLWRSLRQAVARDLLIRSSLDPAAQAHVAADRKLIEAEASMVAGMRSRSPVAPGHTPFRIGTQIGARYALREVLGEGASSLVYAAKDLVTGEDVCVKHLLTGPSELSAKELAREARLTTTLIHPHVVRVLNFGTVWGEPYLVLELAKGGSLLAPLERGPLAPSRAREVMLEVLDGLAFLHDHDVLHLDLKPANIVLDAKGRAKITDFGVALPSSASGWSQTLSSLGGPGIAGTPAYASPEVIAGLPPTERSDLYSAGALLYHLLAGRPYLDLRGLDLQGMREAIRQGIPSPDAPGGPVLAVALRALAKDPDARYTSAREMHAGLTEARPPG